MGGERARGARERWGVMAEEDDSMSAPHSAHCGAKRRHPTRDEALEHIKALVWRNHTTGHTDRSAGLAAYPCDECGAWHVGHQQTAPPCYHYTVGAYLDRIIQADALRPRRPRRDGRSRRGNAPRLVDEPAPLLWFSRNPVWEYSVMKVVPPGEPPGSPIAIGRSYNEMLGAGLLRFAVPSFLAKLRWSDYLRLNPTSTQHRDTMARIGNPTEWLATDEDVPLSSVRAIEVFYRGAWVSVDDIDGEAYDRYLAERRTLYAAAHTSLTAKMRRAAETETEAETETVVDLTEAERILLEDAEARLRAKGEDFETV